MAIFGFGRDKEDPAAPDQYCLVGVEFLGAPDPVTAAIAAYVAKHLPGQA